MDVREVQTDMCTRCGRPVLWVQTEDKQITAVDPDSVTPAGTRGTRFARARQHNTTCSNLVSPGGSAPA